MQIEIREVDSPEVVARAEHAPGLHQALVQLGFNRVGVLEMQVANARTQFAPLFDEYGNLERTGGRRLGEGEQDARVHALLAGEVIAVWQTPEDAVPAFAVVRRYFEEALLAFRTVTEDGVVVETAMTLLPPLSFRNLLQSGALFERGFRFLATALNGPALAVPYHRPGAGYHRQLLFTDVPADLWQRHQERVRAIAPGATIPTHDNLALYLATDRRAAQLNEWESGLLRWVDRLVLIPAGLWMVGVLLLFVFSLVLPESRLGVSMLGLLNRYGGLGFLGVLAVTPFFAYMGMRWLLRTYLVPRLRGPGRPTAAKMINAPKKYGTGVTDA